MSQLRLRATCSRMRCEAQDDDVVQVELRCPECMMCCRCCFTREEMEELDRSQAACREQIVAAYERSVSESMEALAACSCRRSSSTWSARTTSRRRAPRTPRAG